MRISKFKLKNYVSFYDEDAEDVELGPGINFIVGRNNSGKTALIDALCLDRPRAPHRSVETVTVRDGRPSQPVDFEIEFDFLHSTLAEILHYQEQPSFINNSQLRGVKIDRFRRGLACMLSTTSRLRILFEPYRVKVGQHDLEMQVEPSLGGTYYKFTVDDELAVTWDSTGYGYEDHDRPRTCWEIVHQDVLQQIYRFEAERNVERCSATLNELRLNSDASNLAQVMDTARRERTHRYHKFVSLVRKVYPDIQEIVIRKLPRVAENGKANEEFLEVYIGYYETSVQREDLRVPLSGCGSGLAQVMAILYVVVVSEISRIIIIDEPHSFLHPDAVRKLLAIFQMPGYAHHQYILTTHSPTAIASVREKTVLFVERKEKRSTVHAINTKDSKAIGNTLRSLGLRLSDFLGIDAIIWVEGTTEKRCFPLILEILGFQLGGVRFIPIAEIGDPTGKSAMKFMNLLEQVSHDIGLLPREVICVCDGDKADGLVNADTGRDVLTETLPRQNYESYFLDFPHVLDEIMERDSTCDSKFRRGMKARDWIMARRNGQDLDDIEWLKTVNGAQLLDEMFNDLAGFSYEPYKVAYGEEITEKIVEQEQGHFQDIVEIIEPVLPEWSRPHQP